MNVLIIAEHDNVSLKAATRHLVKAAAAFAGTVEVLVAGAGCQEVAEAASRLDGVARVLLADHDCYAQQVAEAVAPLVVALMGSRQVLLAAATTTGKNVLPRVAALLDVAQLSEIVAIRDSRTFVRPNYAGNVLVTVESLDPRIVATVRASAFEAVGEQQSAAPIELLDISHPQAQSRFVSASTLQSARPELTAARVVVSGGRGLGSAENFRLLDGLADKLGAAIGASRAAVDAGYIGNDHQVGQTGKVVAPELYFAIGISGAIQHLAGMKDSKVIVAINKDPEAPIFQVADYGLVQDLFSAIPALEAAL